MGKKNHSHFIFIFIFITCQYFCIQSKSNSHYTTILIQPLISLFPFSLSLPSSCSPRSHILFRPFVTEERHKVEKKIKKHEKTKMQKKNIPFPSIASPISNVLSNFIPMLNAPLLLCSDPDSSQPSMRAICLELVEGSKSWNAVPCPASAALPLQFPWQSRPPCRKWQHIA